MSAREPFQTPSHIRITQRFLGPYGQGEIGTLADQRQ